MSICTYTIVHMLLLQTFVLFWSEQFLRAANHIVESDYDF